MPNDSRHFAGLLYQGLYRQIVLILKKLTGSGLGGGPSVAALHSHPQTPSLGEIEPLGSTLVPESLPLLFSWLHFLHSATLITPLLLAGLPRAASELPLDSPTIALSTPLSLLCFWPSPVTGTGAKALQG